MVLAKASTKEVGGGREAAPGVFFPDRPSLMAFPGGASPTSEDLGKKTRKPYTISKSRESWTDQDHDKFLEALHLFDRDWKKIEAFVGSKTVIQIRSHAQKYFLKVQKNGTNEHVPPPRPKRKAAHPYPQKAVKNATSQIPEAKNLRQTSSLLEPDYSFTRETQPMQRNPMVVTVSSLVQSPSPAEPDSACHLTKGDMANPGVVMPTNCCSSSTESPRTWPTCEVVDQENLVTSLQVCEVMPNFALVYNFIGSVFDPNASGHLQKLVEMDPIDVETVLILMRNLTFNLSSPDFEAHRRSLSAYGGDSGSKAQNIGSPLHARETANTPLLVQGE